jgi:hypothetical protein
LELYEAWANDRLQAADEMEARAGVVRSQAQGCLAGIADQRALQSKDEPEPTEMVKPLDGLGMGVIARSLGLV